ncbi:hypothetical protein QUF76_10825 [Desulfobacterales bacterium HSG16]|nr:hypothetical protein [Desulfobacterales bacterium HSG16]
MHLQDHKLDDEARRLFEELGGIDLHAVADRSSDIQDTQDEKTDSLRILLVDLMCHISAYFMDVRYLEGIKTEKRSFAKITEICGKLLNMPGNDNTIEINYRGFSTGSDVSLKLDYVIIFNQVKVDGAIIQAQAGRMGLQYSHLPKRLGKAFDIFSSHGINSLHIELPEKEQNKKIEPCQLEKLRTALRILSRFNYAYKTDGAIQLTKDKKTIKLPLVKNENSQPDSNLTMLAGINGFTPAKMKEIVQKVHAWMKRMEKVSGVESHTSVYNAIFGIDSLKKKIIKPPVEMNNIKWMLAEIDTQPVTREKAGVAKAVMSNYGSTPLKAAEVMNTIYGNDYKNLDSSDFGKRIKMASELLQNVDKDKDNKDVLEEVVYNFRGRVDTVQEEIFEDVSIYNGAIKVKSDDGAAVITGVHKRILNLLSFYKRKSTAKQKIRSMINSKINFNNQDYEILANDFDISIHDAKELVNLLKECFDSQGRFKRSIFEKNIPEFTKYERKVFEFMWHYLKETPTRNDRVSFLNALQHLIARMKQPKKAIRVLIADILKEADIIKFPDRNGFMLMNLLIRKYNKELNLDIEITPEEVLLIKAGLDKELTTAVDELLAKEEDQVIAKMKAIHLQLIKALDADNSDSAPMPLRYLLSLEREAFIFFSLIGGKTAHSILRSAVRQYGNPDSEIYHMAQSKCHMIMILQHLKVLVRCMGRMKEDTDVRLLEDIQSSEKDFESLGEGPLFADKIRRVIKWTNSSKRNIIQAMEQWQASFPQAADTLSPLPGKRQPLILQTMNNNWQQGYMEKQAV